MWHSGGALVIVRFSEAGLPLFLGQATLGTSTRMYGVALFELEGVSLYLGVYSI